MDEHSTAICSPLSVIDTLFEECSDRSGNSFGEKEHFERLLSESKFMHRIPYLRSTTIGKIPHNSLVRYRGIVQDIYNTEYFVGVYTSKNGEKMALSKYRDVLNDVDGTELDSPGSRLMERLSLLCAPIPGENAWLCGYTGGSLATSFHNDGEAEGVTSVNSKKRDMGIDYEDNSCNGLQSVFCDRSSVQNVDIVDGDKFQNASDHHRNTKRVSFSSEGLDSQRKCVNLNKPHHPTFYADNGDFNCCCVAKIYDCDDDVFKLNDMLELIGVYSLDSMTLPVSMDPLESLIGGDEIIDIPWSASQVPRVHCLTFRRIGSSFPLLMAVETSKSRHSDEPRPCENTPSEVWSVQEPGVGAYGPVNPLLSILCDKPEELAIARTEVLRLLSAALNYDDLAAEYVLLNCISRVVGRSEGVLLGSFPLCLGGIAESDAIISRLHFVLQTFTPRSVVIQASISSLNTNNFQPSKDYDSNYMLPSPLQLGSGTVVLLDESGLGEGVLNEKGMHSVQALRDIVSKQELSYLFAYCSVRISTDLSIIIFSKKSSCSSLFDSGEVVKMPLMREVSRESHDSMMQTPECDYSMLRRWWAGVRQLNVKMSNDLIYTAENDFVAARQADSNLDQTVFSRWLTIARLLAISYGSSEVLPIHWTRMKELEMLRLKRVFS